MGVLVLMSLASCLKTVTNNNSSNPAALAIINLVPYAPPFTVILDNQPVTLTFPYASYDSTPNGALAYDSLYAGIHSVDFQYSGIADSTLAGGLIQFSKNTKYSIYLFDTLSPYGLQAVQLSDNFDSVPLNYAIMRFLHFSPNAPPFDVYFGQYGMVDSLPVFTGQSYIGTSNPSTGTLSNYTAVLTPGNYTVFLDSAGAVNYQYGGSGTLDTFHVQVLPNIAYTMFITGLWDSIGVKAFKLGMIKMN